MAVPDRVEEIPEFLRNVTGGRPLPEAVIEEIKHRYGLIGCSPLTCHTMDQADGVRRASRNTVYIRMRNWKPFIGDAVKQMATDGVARAVAICLAPQIAGQAWDSIRGRAGRLGRSATF